MSHLAGHALPLNVHSSTYCAAAMHMGHMGKDRVLHFGVGELHLVNSAATSDRISCALTVDQTAPILQLPAPQIHVIRRQQGMKNISKK